MKRILSLLLTLAMVLSLCACGGGGDNDTPQTNLPPVDDKANSLESGKNIESNTDDRDAEKVIGDRVNMGTVKNWTKGPVEASEVINEETFPVETGLSVTYDVTGTNGVGMKMKMITKDENVIMELDTVYEEGEMMSRFFDVDGVPYMYFARMVNSGASESHLYKLPVGEDDSTSSADVTESFTNGIGGIDAESINADVFTSVEYIDLVDGYDTFEAVMEDGQECQILLDHETGYLAQLVMPANEEEGIADMVVRFSFNVADDEFSWDVENYEEDTDGSSVLLFLAQMLSLVSTDSMDWGDLMSAEAPAPSEP